MNDKSKTPLAEMMEQAMQAGLKLQEESSKWWTESLAQSATPADWQKRWSASPSDAIRLVQKRMDDSLRLLEQSNRTSLELLKQAMAVTTVESPGDTQAKLQEMWEASLEALRKNAHAVTQTNAKVVESWMQLFAAGSNGMSSKEKTAM